MKQLAADYRRYFELNEELNYIQQDKMYWAVYNIKDETELNNRIADLKKYLLNTAISINHIESLLKYAFTWK